MSYFHYFFAYRISCRLIISNTFFFSERYIVQNVIHFFRGRYLKLISLFAVNSRSADFYFLLHVYSRESRALLPHGQFGHLPEAPKMLLKKHFYLYQYAYFSIIYRKSGQILNYFRCYEFPPCLLKYCFFSLFSSFTIYIYIKWLII